MACDFVILAFVNFCFGFLGRVLEEIFGEVNYFFYFGDNYESLEISLGLNAVLIRLREGEEVEEGRGRACI